MCKKLIESDLVGLAPVKARIKEIAALLLVQRLRKNLNLGPNSPLVFMVIGIHYTICCHIDMLISIMGTFPVSNISTINSC